MDFVHWLTLRHLTYLPHIVSLPSEFIVNECVYKRVPVSTTKLFVYIKYCVLSLRIMGPSRTAFDSS